MGTWTLIQVVFDIFIAVGLFTVVMRMNRAPKDDPRLSRGLQLLQSKIAVLEDLSDRTEVQVNQLTAILDQKSREVQAKVQLAEQHVHEIRVSTERSLEVAKIFQDKIPHAEIIERQSTVRYVQAARLAHQGLDVEEIAKQVDLPKGEIEFIAKVNRDQLQFNEEQLPWWARDNAGQAAFIEGSEGEAAIGSVNSGAPKSIESILAKAFPSSDIAMGGFAGAGEAGGVTVGNSAAMGAENMANTTGAAVAAAAMAQSNAMQARPVMPDAEGDYANEQASRMRAEMALAERQRLVENLSRLQFEMQNLDIQLAKEGGVRDMSGAFEVPKAPTQSLAKLGEEFRRACEQVNQAAQPKMQASSSAQNRDVNQNGGGSLFPPLEQLSAIIPKAIMNDAQMSQAAQAHTGMSQAQAVAAVQVPTQATQPQHQAVPQVAQQTHTESADSAAAKDPALARALAQQKVQAALRASAKPQAAAPAREISPELAAARAMAKEAAAPQPLHLVSQTRNTSGEAPVIKKVQFPRIDNER